MSNLPKVTVNDLLDAGVHFGHNISRWNPKMAPYIYGVRDNIHIINLQQSVPLMQMALKKIYETVKNNGKVLFVGSKVQATDLIAEYAEKCGQFYINSRWLGGTLTNWSTISKSIKKLDNLERILEDDELHLKYTKKEVLNFERKKGKLLKALAGIRKIGGLPDLIVVIDTNREHLAIEEAKKLGIELVAVVDTNSNPDNINYPIPGNDDAIRSIRLYCQLFAESALAGIQDALTDSGADAGLAESIREGQEGMDNVKVIKKSEKLSKVQENVAEAKTQKAEKKTATESKKTTSKSKEKIEEKVPATKAEKKSEAPKTAASKDSKAKTADKEVAKKTVEAKPKKATTKAASKQNETKKSDDKK